MTKEEIEELTLLMSQAIQTHKSLEAFWRKTDLSSINVALDPSFEELVPSLKKMVLLRIEILNSFELLTRINPEISEQVLRRRYLGEVSPDNAYGGYEGDLSIMLDDIVEICGEEYLRKILDADGFDQSKLEDDRVIRSFCEALSLESKEEFFAWKDNVE